MANYAVVRNGTVENMIIWDGHGESPVSDADVIEATADTRIGGTYDGAFHYVEPPAPEPTAEQKARQEKIDSAKVKLENLGLSTEEIKEAFGI
tara:strand:- start:472 stop:750 length:279 start_codon:yes stop_codon:yes gene_type:complete